MWKPLWSIPVKSGSQPADQNPQLGGCMYQSHHRRELRDQSDFQCQLHAGDRHFLPDHRGKR